MGEGRGVYRVLVGPRDVNTETDLTEIGIGGENWIRLVQDRVW
jgi:hypothetical protein